VLYPVVAFQPRRFLQLHIHSCETVDIWLAILVSAIGA